MKIRTFALLSALAMTTPVAAEDHGHGPVVYPANSAGAGPAETNPAPTDATSAPQLPAPPAFAPPPSTPALSPSFPSASSPVQGSSPVMMPPGGAAALAAPPGTGGANGQHDDIYDIRPPFFYLHAVLWPWIVLALLVLLSLGTLLWVWLKSMRERKAKSAYELTLERLEKARALLNEQDPEPYAVFVSETIRQYLGQRFNTPSTRRTTEEFLRQMQADRATPLAQHRDLLKSFLEACDLVKFAHYQPARDELEQVQQRAMNFVTATKPMEGALA